MGKADFSKNEKGKPSGTIMIKVYKNARPQMTFEGSISPHQAFMARAEIHRLYRRWLQEERAKEEMAMKVKEKEDVNA